MKISLGALFLGAAHAFSPSAVGSASSTLAARADASEAIDAAMEATNKYGKTSPEARLAWDAVEEIDAADNSAAFEPQQNQAAMSQAFVEFEAKKEELQQTARAMMSNPAFVKMQSLNHELQSLKMASNTAKPAPASPEQQEALEAAKKAVKEFGADSPEAKMAWEELEEISAAGTGNAIGKRLDEECLVESAAMDACVALEELNRVLNLSQTDNHVNG